MRRQPSRSSWMLGVMDTVKNNTTFDTLLRHWAMLRLLPRWPRRIGAPEIRQRLEEMGFPTTVRTVQRDLDKLSSPFQLFADDHRPRGWCWAKDAKVLDLPAMDPQTALTLHIMERHAKRLLPRGTLRFLQPYLTLAARTLDALNDPLISQWPEKIEVVDAGPMRIHPEVDGEVLETIYQALLVGRRFEGEYRSRDESRYRDYEVNPLGLVFKDAQAYLVATLMSYKDLRQLALHRFRSARMLEEPTTVPTGFSLKSYVREGAFGYPEGDPMQLRLAVHPDTARLIEETPLSSDQKLTSRPDDGWGLVEATVVRSAELRWWIMSFGAAMEILAPEDFRSEIGNALKKAAKRYS